MEFVNANLGQINSIFHTNNVSFTVVKEAIQIVGGKNHFLHLLGHPDLKPYQITVYASFNSPAIITHVFPGHGELKNGFGSSVE
mgnify:CR=1 FL=1